MISVYLFDTVRMQRSAVYSTCATPWQASGGCDISSTNFISSRLRTINRRWATTISFQFLVCFSPTLVLLFEAICPLKSR